MLETYIVINKNDEEVTIECKGMVNDDTKVTFFKDGGDKIFNVEDVKDVEFVGRT